MKLKVGDIVIEYYDNEHLATYLTVEVQPETEEYYAEIVLKNIISGKIWKFPSLKSYGGSKFKVVKAPCRI